MPFNFRIVAYTFCDNLSRNSGIFMAHFQLTLLFAIFKHAVRAKGRGGTCPTSVLTLKSDLKCLCLNFDGKTRTFVIFQVHSWNLWKRLYQYSEEERNIRLQTYFKFLFVRDPLKRLLSAYKNKFIGNDRGVSRSARMHIIMEYRPKDLNKKNNWVSFPEFIQYFSEDRERNQHWRQYEKLCHPCAVNYSFIGHLETLEDDAHLLLKMAAIDDRVSFPPVHKSTSSSEILDYYSQVPVEYITRLGKLYRSDFEMFGYDFPGDLQTLIKNSSSNR